MKSLEILGRTDPITMVFDDKWSGTMDPVPYAGGISSNVYR